jgi:hypothetical protein
MTHPNEPDFGWTMVRLRDGLDPARYLGEFGDLPLGAGKPGDWCEVVMRDSDGEMRWTLLAVEGKSLSVTGVGGPHASRRLAPRATGRRAARPLREWEREDEEAAASSAPCMRRAAAGTDGRGSSRPLRLVPSIEAT